MARILIPAHKENQKKSRKETPERDRQMEAGVKPAGLWITKHFFFFFWTLGYLWHLGHSWGIYLFAQAWYDKFTLIKPSVN